MKNFNNILTIIGSGNQKFKTHHSDTYRIISCEADVRRWDAIIESCNVQFTFDEKDKFTGVHLDIKPVMDNKNV